MSDVAHGVSLRKRSLTIAGHRTSVSLEDAFWDGLRAIARRRDMTLPALVAEADGARGPENLSSALRVLVLRDVLALANMTRST